MKRVAVVEDNEDNMMLVEALLEDMFVVEMYAEPEPALEALPKSPPDVVLMDISLPRMDGRQLLAKLRQTEFGATPVIALTAHAMDGDRAMFLSAGFDDYVSKPIVDEKVLFDAIDRAIARTGGA